MSFLDRIYEANTASLEEYCPLLYGDRQVGLLWQKQVDLLLNHGAPLQLRDNAYLLDSG